MIASIRGKIISISESLIVEAGGIGYKINIPSSVLEGIHIGDEIMLYTHQYVREDSLDLYGFRLLVELELFEKLIGVSGIGPKAGLALLSQFTAAELQQSIMLGDTSLLTKVSGIGKKTAERLILELKGSFGDLTEGTGTGLSNNFVASALEQLGYSSDEVLSALKQIDRSLKEEEQIKAALTLLGQAH